MKYALSSEIRRQLVVWGVFLLIMELLGLGLAGARAHIRFDFEGYYTASSLIRSHPEQLYDLTWQEKAQDAHAPHSYFLPFYHPAYEAILYAPLSFMSFTHAYLSDIAFNVLLLLAAYFIFRSIHSGDLPRLVWLESKQIFIFLFLPAVISIIIGQDSILLLLLYCLVWRELESGSDMTAGCIAALALFKFQIAIPIAILVAIRRGRRFTTGFIITSAGISALCFGILGLKGTRDYIALMAGAVSAIDKNGTAQHGMSFMTSALTNLAGLFHGCCDHFLHSSVIFGLLVGLSSLVLFGLSAALARRSEPRLAFSIAILCGLMVSYHSFVYDLTISLLPIALLVDRIPRYLLVTLYIVPLVLLPFGAKWFFLDALPELALLLYAIFFFLQKQVPTESAIA